MGTARDEIAACSWYAIAAEAGDEVAQAARERLAAKMYPSRVAEAEARAMRWRREVAAR